MQLENLKNKIMLLGDKKINCISIRLDNRFSLSVSDLGNGNESLLEGLLFDEKTNSFIGVPFHFKSFNTLRDEIEKIKDTIQLDET